VDEFWGIAEWNGVQAVNDISALPQSVPGRHDLHGK